MEALPHIPGFDIVQRLGGGPMTTVWLAHAVDGDVQRAVKTIRPDWEDRDTAQKLLQREARAGLTVRHSHLVKVLHAHVTRPPYFLVMELLGGESLRRRLTRDYHLDVPTSLSIVRQTAEALSALHRAGFAHGDIKPENIRLVGPGDARLIDLGFAHRPGENRSFFDRGYVLGTVSYMAPELCRFDPTAGLETDLFSLGLTLFEMLTGRLPFAGGTVEQTFHQHCNEEPDDIRQHVRRLPPGVADLIDRLLSRDPAKRPRASVVVQQLVSQEIAALGRRRSA